MSKMCVCLCVGGEGGGEWADEISNLFLSILIIVSLSGKSDSNSLSNVLHSLGPDELVQVGIDTDIPVVYECMSVCSVWV